MSALGQKGRNERWPRRGGALYNRTDVRKKCDRLADRHTGLLLYAYCYGLDAVSVNNVQTFLAAMCLLMKYVPAMMWSNSIL